MSASKRAGFLSLNRTSELVWGSGSYEAEAPCDTDVRMRKVLKTSQGCHTCNLTDEHPEVTRPAVRFLQMPLMKRNFFRVSQVCFFPSRRLGNFL